MASDAKLGLVLGITIVLIVALVFYRVETPAAATSPQQNRPANAQSSDPAPASRISTSR